MKEKVQSNRPEKYFFELQQKKAEGKKLIQRERVFIELYANKEVPCYFFVKQLSPSILNYNARIDELRAIGFCIPKPVISWHNGQKHSTYTMEKEFFMQESKKPWWEDLFKW